MHTPTHRTMLRRAAAAGNVERVLLAIRTMNPGAFHTGATLAGRVFFDQPLRGEPCQGFIKIHAPDDLAA